MTRDQQVTAIAEAFAEVLRQWLTREELETVRSRNACQSDPHVCHSHDFCDANMAMAPAFEQIVGREPDVASMADAALWSEAWDLAKRLYLTA
jgi:hypothetical protein